MPRRRITFAAVLLAGLGLSLSACGGSSSKNAEPTPASVRECLERAGYQVVASGDLPVFEGSKALGVRIEGQRGKIMPGHLSVAIFWYDSVAKVESLVKSNPGEFPMVVTRSESRIFVGYDPAPSADLQGAVNVCTEGPGPR
jgi:hypothetical protein